ncbi:carbohydrate ABC transporter permease [Streptomyces sp. DSM 41524]|uniref:Carbohydrate ABC transporter permease n=3 Tax=Streptomyces violaceusniger group TaxID=2839105 RepID=A0ABP4CHH8_9ACTN|nr:MULTISPECIES: carbohydrate ABC transporter permease [Streptomyces]EXU67429.1 sugar ABC transporter permease [Streptomyces sp. PRh5]MEE4590833.1 carbohydrate ABC transporter permease [Streptomyces sp. DSM 41524]
MTTTTPTTPVTPSRGPSRPLGKPFGGSKLTSRGIANAVVLIAALYTMLPALWLLLASTKNADALFGSDIFSLGDFSFGRNLSDLFSMDGGLYGEWYVNSLLYAVVGALVGSLISVAAGYAFDKYEFRHKEKFFGLVLTGVMVPPTVLALPLYLVASEIGMVNTFWAVFIPVLFNPFGVYLARLLSSGYVPNEVLEASRVDGAGELQTYVRVSLRMLGPGFVTVFLFQLTAIWNNFFLPMVMLSDQHLYPLSLGLYTWNSAATVSPEYYPLVVIGSLLAVVPLIVAFVLLQRYWKSGLTAGSVK